MDRTHWAYKQGYQSGRNGDVTSRGLMRLGLGCAGDYESRINTEHWLNGFDAGYGPFVVYGKEPKDFKLKEPDINEEGNLQYEFYRFTKQMPHLAAAVMDDDCIVACENAEHRKKEPNSDWYSSNFDWVKVLIISRQEWNKLRIVENRVMGKLEDPPGFPYMDFFKGE